MTNIRAKQILSCLFAAIFLAASLAACGESSVNEETNIREETPEQIPSAEEAVPENAEKTEEVLIKDDLPEDLDFDGETITIHIRNGDNGNPEGNCVMEMTVEELNGELLNDAIYNRNLAVNERLNVQIDPFVSYDWTGYGNCLAEIRASINANEDQFDIIAGWCQGNITSLALEKCFLPLDDVPYLDMQKPWWNQALADAVPIGGSRYFVTGESNILTSLGSALSVFVNEAMQEEFQIGSLADYVLEGTWTIDKMGEITEMVKEDVDGNGRMDQKDRFGLVLINYHPADAFYTSLDIHQISMDSEGNMTYTPDAERIHTALEKVYNLHYNNPGSLGWLPNGVTRPMFSEGRALMTFEWMEAAREDFREMNDSYYIIPMPKLDEAQEQYYSYIFNNLTVLSVPVTNQNTDAAYATMEALASESYINVTPVFFEDCMQNKYARSEATSQMLEIIRESCYVDYEYIYSGLFNKPDFIFRDLIGAKNSDSASWIAKNSKAIQKMIDRASEKLSQ